jgi:hypothetical protein
MSKGVYTDHVSHMNAARLFPRMGFDLYRKPIAGQFSRLTGEEMSRMPADVQAGGSNTGGVYVVPGWPADKPLVIAWTTKTRMYPPGDLVLVAPIAALYHYTSLSLAGANRLLIGWFIVLAHVALFFFILVVFENKVRGIAWLGCFFVYAYVMRFTLEGFYDAAAIVPLVVCARFLARRQGLAAALAYCVAALIHFRAFFLGPWALYAGGLMLRNRFWRHLRVRGLAALLVAAACAATSLYAFRLDWTSLDAVPVFNPVYAGGLHPNLPMIGNLAVILLVCGTAMAWRRAWLDLATLLWFGAIMLSLREFCIWHLVIPLAWIAAPSKHGTVRAARLAFMVTVAAVVFNESLAPSWLWQLYTPPPPG